MMSISEDFVVVVAFVVVKNNVCFTRPVMLYGLYFNRRNISEYSIYLNNMKLIMFIVARIRVKRFFCD